jgi:phosphatidate cytidylyltransferase
MNNMLLRAITGSVFVAIVVACVMHSPLALNGLLWLFGVLCLSEYFNWYKNNYRRNILTLAILLGSLLLTYTLSCVQSPGYWSFWPLLLLSFPILAIGTLYAPSGSFLTFVSKSLLGWFIIIVPLLCISLLQAESYIHSYYYVLLFFVTMWVNDTGAYLSGRAFGKKPLFPRISPKKTWEGLIGGIILSLIAAVVSAHYLGKQQYLFDIGFVGIIALTGTYGDLVESALKRELNMKDSGKMLPGHGGILDRLDGVLLAAPFAFTYYYFCSLIVR